MSSLSKLFEAEDRYDCAIISSVILISVIKGSDPGLAVKVMNSSKIVSLIPTPDMVPFEA